MKTRQLLLAILLIITLSLIVSCNNEVVSGPGYGSVAIFTGNNSKSVQPAADQIAFSYYIIHSSCSTPGINPIEKRFEGSSVKIENMIEGQWTLYVEGFNSSDNLIGKSESQNVTIVRDSTTNLNFFLEAIEGKGTLTLSINVQTSKVSTIDCALKVGNESYRTITMTTEDRTSNSNGTYTFSKAVNDIDNGFYSSTVTMKDSEESVIGIALTPAIHIYANLESAYEFSWENLKSLLPSVDTPIPSVEPGRCFYNTEVSFSTIEEGTTIYYSFTGTDYQKYTSPLHIADDSTIYVYSEKQNLKKSEIVEYSYVCRVKTPTVSLESGNYTLEELSNVTIAEADENATVYYTLDGSNPSISSTRIKYLPNTSLSFDKDSNLRIVAIEDGFRNSEILSISYTIVVPVPEPTLLSGTFTGDQELSFIVPQGARVYYTNDGSIPNENSTLYTEPITITNTCTIKAITVIDGFEPSHVLNLEYNFTCLFNITNSGVVTPINKNSLPANVVIPKRINGITVTGIGNSAFSGCTGLTSITIPDSVTSIGSSAFYNCSGLTNIKIPSSVTSIGSSAFYNCSGLENVYISDLSAWLSINFGSSYYNPIYSTYSNPMCYASNLYLNNNLVTEIIIPNSVTRIGDCAFYNCKGLTSITIPNSVTSIGDYAFYNCKGLTSIEIPNSVTSIGDYAFYNCKGLTSITIPDSVTSIGDYAFYNCKGLTSIEIPNSVTSIGDNAFYDWTNSQTIHINYGGFSATSSTWKSCNALIEVTIPNTTTSIGDYAFYNCKDLTSITIPNSVTSIGNGAFGACTSLTSIEIPNSVTSIGNGAFGACTSLKSITIPNSVTSIGDCAFYNCKGLTSIEIPNSVTSIGYSVFSGWTNSQTIHINYGGFDGVYYVVYYNVGESEFTWESCNALIEVTIPNTTTSIGDYAFYECTGLTSITIPDSVTSIGYSAFRDCTGLTSITIGNSVTSVGDLTFLGCTGLENVYISDLSAWLSINFSELCSSPMSYASYLYLNNNLVTEIIIPNSVTSIGDYAFYNCKDLTSIKIPNSVTSIGDYAFYNCKGLTSIEIPNSVTSIGLCAFSDWTNSQTIHINYGGFSANTSTSTSFIWKFCSASVEVTIPNTTTSIGDYAFYNCAGLTSITIPDSVTSIGNGAFGACTSLTSITIPNSVTSIGNGAFGACTSLTSITIPNSVTSIGYCAFSGCKGVTSIEIPTSVVTFEHHYSGNFGYGVFSGYSGSVTFAEGTTSIPNYAFYYASVTSFTIPNSVTSIGDYAFYNCKGLTSITIPDSVTSIGDYAFRGCTGLTSITIPNSITSIGNSAFYDCTGLTSVVFEGTQDEWLAINGVSNLPESVRQIVIFEE